MTTVIPKRKINVRLFSMIGILVIMWVLFRIQVGDFYFSGESMAKLVRDMASWTILAAGVTLVIVTGNIDLSIGSLLALVAATGALLMNPEYGPGLSPEISVAIAVATGVAAGFLQGVLVAYGRIPSFIVTLGGFFIFRGLTQKVSAFDPRIEPNIWVARLGYDYVAPSTGLLLAGGASALLILVMIISHRRRARLGLPTSSLLTNLVGTGLIVFVVFAFVFKVNEYRGIPLQVVVMAVVLLGTWFIASRTVLGKHLYAIGGNIEAARLSGIRTERSIVAAFTIMGLLAGVAGIVWMAQNQGSTKNAGQYYELYAIAAAVIGGTSLMGGRGAVGGTFLGGLVMATVIQGMDYSSLENWIQLVVRGAVLVIAVGVDIMAKNPPAWVSRIRSMVKRA
ncbi:MAG: hypothetical protein WB699_08545 [Bacteroidota bacterium]